MTRGIRWCMGLLVAAVVAGCASTPDRNVRVSKYVPRQERQTVLGKPKPADKKTGRGTTEDYASRTLQPGDKITVSLMGIRDPPTFQVVISESGNLNLPYLGNIAVAGKTKSEAEQMIEKAYVDGQIFKSITVVILPPEVEYFVRGEVNRPGGYPLTRDLTFLQALSKAGGFTEFADPAKIGVSRGTGQFFINARKIEAGSQKDQVVQPGDVIVVYRSWH